MIGNNDTIATNFDSVPGVGDALDSLDEEWFASRDPLPLFNEPFGLFPGVRMPVPVWLSACKQHRELVIRRWQHTICSHPSISALHALDLFLDQFQLLSSVSRN